jgi:precorrin-2 dehydrogenase/sirohydrochlorin ferrochelatase
LSAPPAVVRVVVGARSLAGGGQFGNEVVVFDQPTCRKNWQVVFFARNRSVSELAGSNMSLFPIFLKLAGRCCLVIGAGTVGEAKIQGLIEAGAAVRLVAPRATPAVERWAAAGEISWFRRTFEPADLNGVFLVVAATNAHELNEHIFREAEQRGILCNAVDDPPHCDFYYPSVVGRGDLQIAISTAGHSPALAQRLRRELEQQFVPEYAEWVVRLGRVRRGLFRRGMEPERRRLLLHRLASEERFETFLERARAREESALAGHRS